jgi:hypothetical protein
MDESFFTQDFESFARGLSVFDIALYAGVALVLWTLFKDKLSPVQAMVLSVVESLKDLLNLKKPSVVNDIVLPEKIDNVVIKDKDKDDIFFKLVVSWKQTRELAMLSGCKKAVEVADEMFPYLSPNICSKQNPIKDEAKV